MADASRRPRLATAAVAALVVSAARVAGAQTAPPAAPRDTTARPTQRDTAPAAAPDTSARATRGARRRPTAAQRPGLVPPISAGRAFRSSLLLPGLGQSRLQRPTAGAVFVGLEIGIVAMLVKSNKDLRSVRSNQADTVATSYPVDSLGVPVATPTTRVGGLNQALVQARRLHREDWVAALVFNHLISGAEAFVSANLYDLPAQITARPSAQGTVVALSIQW